MKILLNIENIAERRRLSQWLEGSTNLVSAKSAQGAVEYLGSLDLDAVICDLVIGGMSVGDFFTESRKNGDRTPRFLCLVPNRTMTQPEIEILRKIIHIDGIDLMKKSEVSDGILEYLSSNSRPESTPPRPVGNSIPATSPESKAPPVENLDNLKSSIGRLDQKQDELANEVSHMQSASASVREQLSAMEARIQSLESSGESKVDAS